jgi:hypothetical protein
MTVRRYPYLHVDEAASAPSMRRGCGSQVMSTSPLTVRIDLDPQ